uniref:Uncharacterized protein n=1 Tax=Chenopodium quinoa TaxID=63459 RepID=A0A803LBA7_CHEQI
MGGESVLHLCVKHKQPKALRFLVKRMDDGELLNLDDALGNTVLHLAVAAKQPEEIIKKKPELVELVDQIKRSSPLHIASAKGNLPVVEILLVVNPSICYTNDQDEALRFLIEMMDDNELLNFGDALGNTVLHLAVAAKQSEVR